MDDPFMIKLAEIRNEIDADDIMGKNREVIEGPNKTMINKQTFRDVLAIVSKGHSVTDYCDQKGVSILLMTEWLDNLEGRALELYEYARKARAASFAEKILKVLDSLEMGLIEAPAARVMCDQYKWFASKMDPDLWSEKSQVNVNIKSTHELHLIAVKEMAEARVIEHDEAKRVIDSNA